MPKKKSVKNTAKKKAAKWVAGKQTGKTAKAKGRKASPKAGRGGAKKTAKTVSRKKTVSLGKKLLESLRKKLEEERERLRMSLGMIDQDVGDLNVGDVIDMAINRETMALRKGRQENDQLQLEMVEAALERMGEGTYGLCLDCGEPIEIPRLEALPYARLCIACKTKEEQERRGRIP